MSPACQHLVSKWKRARSHGYRYTMPVLLAFSVLSLLSSTIYGFLSHFCLQ